MCRLLEYNIHYLLSFYFLVRFSIFFVQIHSVYSDCVIGSDLWEHSKRLCEPSRKITDEILQPQSQDLYSFISQLDGDRVCSSGRCHREPFIHHTNFDTGWDYGQYWKNVINMQAEHTFKKYDLSWHGHSLESFIKGNKENSS